MRGLAYALIPVVLTSCSHHEVDTHDEWCEQIVGVDIMEKYRPFWAAIPSVSFDGESIRDDFVSNLNSAYMEKVEARTDRMVWRIGTDLHMRNLSIFFDVPAGDLIQGWVDGVERSIKLEHLDAADECLYGSLTSLFDRLLIHTAVLDDFGLRVVREDIFEIDTSRQERLKDPV